MAYGIIGARENYYMNIGIDLDGGGF